MSKFEFLEHTSDLKIRAHGATLDESFSNAALAIFSAMTDINAVNPVEWRKIELKAADIDALLHDWLTELIFLFSTEHMLFKDFSVSISGGKLTAIATGESFNPEKHTIEKEVKAITYHDMKIVQGDDDWMIEVVCDI